MKKVILIVISWAMAWTLSAKSAQSSMHIFMESPITKYANMGVLLVNLTTGDTLESFRANSVIPPASTLKTLTTATALEILGSQFRFQTTLEYSGYIANGVLYGDLYIHGGCDPTLGNIQDGQGFLNAWVQAIRNAGILRIEGSIVADMSMLDGDATNPGWVWEDIGNYYGMGVMSLAYMDNTMNIILHSGPVGSTANVLYTTPEVPGLQFENHLRCTTIEYDGAYVHGYAYTNLRYLTGAIPSNLGQFGIRGDIPNPGLLLAQHLDKWLDHSGIMTTAEPRYITENDRTARTTVYVHHSMPLEEIIKRTNHESVNLYAETLYRYLGTRIAVPGTLANSEAIVRNYWRNHGVDLTGTKILDGCGLAPQDALSPNSLVQLMTYMNGSKERNAFYNSLPVSGQSGTLRSLLSGTPLEGRVHAKSGTIGGTRNYAGYIDMPNGERWAFAILVNSANGKAVQIKNVIERFLLDVYSRNK